MKKELLALAVISMSFVTGRAQEAETPVQDNTPLKNSFTAAVTIGYNNYTNATALNPGAGHYSARDFSTNWTDRQLGIGLDLGWFMTDNWKLSIGGGYNFQNNPGYEGLEGTFDPAMGDEIGDGSIPSYSSRPERSNFNFMAFMGIDRYFHLKNIRNLVWYTGLRAQYAYGQDRLKYAGQAVTGGEMDASDYMGRSVTDTWNLGASLVFGAEYYITRAIYVGAQVDVASYRYSKSTAVPQPGLGGLASDSHNIGAFACPMLKVGFRMGKSRPCVNRELPKAEPEKVIVREVVHDTVFVEVTPPETAIEALPRANVFFSLAKSDVSADESASIRRLINEVNGRNVYYLVIGYADKGTGNAAINKKYAQQRAEKVASILNSAYGIAKEDIKVDSKGDTEQPFAENDMNRVAIITVEKK